MVKFVPKFKYKINIALTAAFIAVIIIYFVLYFSLVPGGPALGVTDSPERLAWSLLITALLLTPTMLMAAVWDYNNQRRRAEGMGVLYEEGKTYPYMTTRRAVLWGLGTALFIATGSVPAAVFDLGALTISMIAVLFGPIDTMVICFATWIIRGPLAYGMGPLMVIGAGWSDSKYGYVMSYMWHRWARPKYKAGTMGKAMAMVICLGSWFLMYLFQQVATVWASFGRFMASDPVWLLNGLFTHLITFYPQALFNAILGVVLAFAIARYVWPKEIPEEPEIHLDDLVTSSFIFVEGIIYFIVLADAIYNPKIIL